MWVHAHMCGAQRSTSSFFLYCSPLTFFKDLFLILNCVCMYVCVCWCAPECRCPKRPEYQIPWHLNCELPNMGTGKQNSTPLQDWFVILITGQFLQLSHFVFEAESPGWTWSWSVQLDWQGSAYVSNASTGVIDVCQVLLSRVVETSAAQAEDPSTPLRDHPQELKSWRGGTRERCREIPEAKHKADEHGCWSDSGGEVWTLSCKVYKVYEV